MSLHNLHWYPNTQYYDQVHKMFMKCVEFKGIKLCLGFDHGLLQGVFTLNGQDITNVVCDDHYSGFEAEIAAEYEHE